MPTTGAKQMPEKSPKISDIENQGIIRLKQLEPNIDASWYGRFTLNLVRAFAGAAYLVCLYAQRMFKATFVQFAKGEDLEIHAKENAIQRKPAVGSTGNVTVYGAENTIIPLFSEFQSGNRLIFQTNEESYISRREFTIQNHEQEAGLLWLDVGLNHNITSQAMITLDGFAPDSLNQSHFVVGVDATRVCIHSDELVEVPGEIQVIMSTVAVTCQTSGLGTNISSGEELSSKIAGVEKAIIPFDGLSGGADVESDSDLRQRIQKARSIIEGVFTAPQVELAALNVPGNTRAWVITPTNKAGGTRGNAGYLPRPGEVVVYPVRDDDPSIIPNQTVLELTKQEIIKNGKMPCHTRVEDIFVLAAHEVKVNITIKNLVPDTPSMRKAVQAEFKANMQDWLNLSDGLTLKQVNQFILSARDEAGNRIINFDIVEPMADIVGVQGQLLTAGDVICQ